MRLRPIGASIVLALVVALPGAAQAQGLFTGFIGTTRNVKVTEADCPPGGDCVLDGQFTWGFSAGTIGTVGFEVDFGVTDDFFGGSEVGIDNNLITLTGNLLVSVPIDRGGPGFRPYAVGGMGLIKTRVTGVSQLVDFSRNDLGMDLGFGAIGFMSNSFGIRGDFRYFRRLTKEEEGFGFELGDISFWRVSIGAALRF